MKAWRLITPVLVFVALCGGMSSGVAATGDADIKMSIDANVENGACRTSSGAPSIDTIAQVAVGDTYEVGVCLSGHPFAPDAIDVRVLYNADLTEAPEVEDVVPALDDNPDANDGDGGADGTRLGEGWDCTISVANVYPKGNDPNTPEADAFMFCLASLTEPSSQLTASPALLATVTFVAKAEGVESLTMGANANVFGVNCPPIGTITCEGAEIYIGVQPSEEALATATAQAAVSGGEATPGTGDGGPDGDATPTDPTAAAASATAVAATVAAGGPTPSTGDGGTGDGSNGDGAGDDGSSEDGEDDDDSGTNSATTVAIIVGVVLGLAALGGLGYLGYRRMQSGP
jgi:hypothetical protein